MATVGTIAGWFDRGVAQGATHMIVKWDSFDGPDGDYPVYVMPGEDPRKRAEGGDRVMEVYILDTARREEQLKPGTRVWNWE